MSACVNPDTPVSLLCGFVWVGVSAGVNECVNECERVNGRAVAPYRLQFTRVCTFGLWARGSRRVSRVECRVSGVECRGLVVVERLGVSLLSRPTTRRLHAFVHLDCKTGVRACSTCFARSCPLFSPCTACLAACSLLVSRLRVCWWAVFGLVCG